MTAALATLSGSAEAPIAPGSRVMSPLGANTVTRIAMLKTKNPVAIAPWMKYFIADSRERAPLPAETSA